MLYSSFVCTPARFPWQKQNAGLDVQSSRVLKTRIFYYIGSSKLLPILTSDSRHWSLTSQGELEFLKQSNLGFWQRPSWHQNASLHERDFLGRHYYGENSLFSVFELCLKSKTTLVYSIENSIAVELFNLDLFTLEEEEIWTDNSALISTHCFGILYWKKYWIVVEADEIFGRKKYSGCTDGPKL